MSDANAAVQYAPLDKALRSMFAARKEVFIDLLNWDLGTIDGAFEVDQFDDPYAHYLVLLGAAGRHRASVRLLSTERPHILGNLYAYLSDGPVPTGTSICEITRFCLDRNQTTMDRRSARNQLITALAEHAVQSGITTYTGVAEFSWFQQIKTFGWDCASLGPPVRDKGKLLVGLRIIIDDYTIDGLKRAGTYEPLSLHINQSSGVKV